MAMGEAANACQYAEQLEEWVELASMESLESILVKPKPKGGRPKKRTRQAAEEHADPNEPDPSSPDPRCWRQMPVTFEDHSADAVCCWYPKLLIPLYLQIKIITAVCAQTSPSPEVHMAYPLLRTERRLDRMEMPLRPYHGVSDNEKETQPRLRQLKRELCEELRTRLVSHPARGIASRMKKSLSRLEKEEPLDS
ncbi:hypothetical protein AGDE_14594 [Angomonas deanei]|uniref:Uncharacterized protein n=1 Tax=Angomonas deanei TaxID=59799 RepID=A0A7G2CRD9_9TRYP|nr:hypothetical protein AGDE_14594 [Angomonas deanei]CAD2222065.1 hypothetical protein, conserved [Angomonas deanei]|eukprot:EPY20575.1 hypothetical protein AGDE_14594 [Angomonas deanei]